MTPEFKYAVISTNVDGNKSTARFTNAKSAAMWAVRLKEDGMNFVVYYKPPKCVEFTVSVTLGELKKKAGPLPQPKNKRGRS